MLLRWLLNQGISAIPKSGTSSRILLNTHLFDFDLSEEDMKKLSSLEYQVGEKEECASKIFDWLSSLMGQTPLEFTMGCKCNVEKR